MMMAVFRLETELTLFLRMRTKEIVKTWRKCIPTDELFPCYMNWGSLKRKARADFGPEARKLAFLRMRSENRPKTCVSCCQIAKIFVLL